MVAGWQLWRGGTRSKIQFKYTCCSLGVDQLKQCARFDAGIQNANANIVASIRVVGGLHVHCGPREAMRGWRLVPRSRDAGASCQGQSCSGTTITIRFKIDCCVPLGRSPLGPAENFQRRSALGPAKRPQRLPTSDVTSFRCNGSSTPANTNTQLATMIGMHPVSRSFGCLTPRNMRVLSGDFAGFLFSKLRGPAPVSFVRFGDGEWMCALGMTFENIDRQMASPDLCEELAKLTACQGERPGVIMMFSHHICDFRKHILSLGDDLGTWFPFFGFLDILRHDNSSLPEMMATLLARGPVVLVGPAFLGRLHAVFGHSAHILVPNPVFCKDLDDAWTAHLRIEKEILAASEKAGNTSVNFLVAGGMAAKVIILRMVSKLKHKDSFLDIGSTFDHFAGRQSRDYHAPLKKFISSSKDPKTRLMLGWFNETDVDKVGC